jgi:hypothetical protein
MVEGRDAMVEALKRAHELLQVYYGLGFDEFRTSSIESDTRAVALTCGLLIRALEDQQSKIAELERRIEPMEEKENDR